MCVCACVCVCTAHLITYTILEKNDTGPLKHVITCTNKRNKLLSVNIYMIDYFNILQNKFNCHFNVLNDYLTL